MTRTRCGRMLTVWSSPSKRTRSRVAPRPVTCARWPSRERSAPMRASLPICCTQAPTGTWVPSASRQRSYLRARPLTADLPNHPADRYRHRLLEPADLQEFPTVVNHEGSTGGQPGSGEARHWWVPGNPTGSSHITATPAADHAGAPLAAAGDHTAPAAPRVDDHPLAAANASGHLRDRSPTASSPATTPPRKRWSTTGSSRCRLLAAGFAPTTSRIGQARRQQPNTTQRLVIPAYSTSQ